VLLAPYVAVVFYGALEELEAAGVEARGTIRLASIAPRSFQHRKSL
jgi:hypothetical protein